MIHWNASPEIVTIGPLTLRWYGMLFAGGFLAAYYALMAMFRRDGRPDSDAGSVLTHTVIGTVIGARLGHCLFYEPEYYLSDPLRILKIWEGGLASHGATLGIMVAVWIYCRKKVDQSFLYVVDRVAITVPLAGAMIRLGNLMNSEIVGKPTDVPWAFVFERFDPVPRHPAQLYEAIAYFMMFGILWNLFKRKAPHVRGGYFLGWLFVILFVFRFFVEFVKEAQVPWENALALNMGQLLSVPFILLGIWLIIRGRVRPA